MTENAPGTSPQAAPDPQKAFLRKRMHEAVAEMSPSERDRADELLVHRFRAVRLRYAAHFAGPVLGYMPLRDEPDIRPILQMILDGGELVLPRVQEDGLVLHRVRNLRTGLVRGRFGLLEAHPASPVVAPARITAALIPGRAFTAACARLGRGGGYYDRLIAAIHAFTVAFCYDCQVLEHLPQEAHDRPADLVLTPTHLHRRPLLEALADHPAADAKRARA